jgi:hypothetical protein
MPPPNKWYRRPLAWLELFALFNLAGLAPDIFLAHSVNHFHHAAEYVPLAFSLIAPVLLVPAMWALATSRLKLWRVLGNSVGWTSVLIGVVGLLLHLKSQFFQQWTLASLVYAAPFAAPLAYTGIGLLLIMNRMVDGENTEWSLWVIFLALGGFVGNFVFSVTDHAQNGFYHSTEWIPVISSGMAVGFLFVPLVMKINRAYLRVCTVVMFFQAAVGILGFALHAHADIYGTGPTLFDRVVFGAPIFAPMLFPDLVMLAFIGLWVLYRKLPAAESTIDETIPAAQTNA